MGCIPNLEGGGPMGMNAPGWGGTGPDGIGGRISSCLARFIEASSALASSSGRLFWDCAGPGILVPMAEGSMDGYI